MIPTEPVAKVLFICTNNICRSPTAHGVFEIMVADNGMAGVIHTDSAGTHARSPGEPPDRRALVAAANRGYDLGTIKSRLLEDQDFAQFDYILAMDESHLNHMHKRAGEEQQSKISLLMAFAREKSTRDDVPDPYFGPLSGFETVLDLVETGAAGLLRTIREHHHL